MLPYPDQLLVLGGGFVNKKTSLWHYQYTSANDIEDLCCDLEEADTKMIIHCRNAVLSSELENVAVCLPDTDVAILVADKARFIPIHRICSSLGKEICRILIGFHVLTGCDSTSGFAGNGKILKDSFSSYFGLKTLGDDINISEEIICNLQQLFVIYVCKYTKILILTILDTSCFVKRERKMNHLLQRLTVYSTTSNVQITSLLYGARH